MTDYFELLHMIAQEFNVSQGPQESDTSWTARVIYSFLGQVGYTSLWDTQEDLQPSSITHFKRRIEKTLESLLDIYPEMVPVFLTDYSQQSDEIYQLFLDAGVIYSKPNRIIAPPFRIGVGKKIVFLRGNSISEKRWISGLGCYYPSDQKGQSTENSIAEMFQLTTKSLSNTWQDVVSEAYWKTAQPSSDLMFLRLSPPFSYGYWIDTPDCQGDITLARQGFQGSYLYYLCRVDNNALYLSQLPVWMTEGKNYRGLANACLCARGGLPPTRFHIDSELVNLNIEYLYPPEELNLILLYSWPIRYVDYPNHFKRTMSLSVFEEIKSELEKTGYQFVEE